MFFTFLRGMWYYLQVTIIVIGSPIGASLCNIGTRLCSQRTTLSSVGRAIIWFIVRTLCIYWHTLATVCLHSCDYALDPKT